jgi:hypothetical protein
MFCGAVLPIAPFDIQYKISTYSNISCCFLHDFSGMLMCNCPGIIEITT